MKRKLIQKYVRTALVLPILPLAAVRADTSPPEKSFSPPSIENTPTMQENVISDNYSVNWREFSLKICLELNYESLGAYKTEKSRDYTTASPPISPQQSIRLVKYIKKQAGNFYTENLPIDSELSPPPYNAIFARCMNFYQSRDLIEFIQKLERAK